MKTNLIKGGTIVNPDKIEKSDILIQGEKIKDIRLFKKYNTDFVIDATGLLVLPGAVDPHVHFNDEFMGTISKHDYYTGTLAAAFGGVTSIIDFSNQVKGEPLHVTLKTKFRESHQKALIDWGVHPVITHVTPYILHEIPEVVDLGAPTIKCYMTYRNEGLMVEDHDLIKIMERLTKANGMLMVHAEDNDTIEKNVPHLIKSGKTNPIYHAWSRPPESEYKAIQRCLLLAKKSRGRLFIVHIASDKGMHSVHEIRKQGFPVFAETCTHYLVFTEEKLKQSDGIKWICSPPLRSQSIQDRLWQGLEKGFISMVSSDDAAFSWKSKLSGKNRFDKCPNGIPGIEPRLNILYSMGVVPGRLSLMKMVELISSNPARLFGLWPQKGHLAPGSDADIVLFDPKEKWIMNQDTLHMATDWSAYENIEMTGKIKKVFSRGELIIDGEQCLARAGRGRFLYRQLDPAEMEKA